MIRLSLLLLTPFLAGCDLANVLNPGAESRQRYEYVQQGLIQPPKAQEAVHIAQTPIPPTVEVAETAPEVIEVVAPEPVYVPPDPQKPSCQPVYAIFNCGPAGEIIWL